MIAKLFVERLTAILNMVAELIEQVRNKWAEHCPACSGVSIVEYDNPNAANIAANKDPSHVGHMWRKKTSGKVMIAWVRRSIEGVSLHVQGRLASRHGKVAMLPVLGIRLAHRRKLSDGVLMLMPTSIYRTFCEVRGLNFRSPSQATILGYGYQGKGTIRPYNGQSIVVASSDSKLDDCQINLDAEVWAFQSLSKGVVGIKARLLVMLGLAAKLAPNVFERYYKYLVAHFIGYYGSISSTERSVLSRHALGIGKYLSIYRLPAPEGLVGSVRRSIVRASLTKGIREGAYIKCLSGYAYGTKPGYWGPTGLDIPYGVVIVPNYHGIVTGMLHRFPVINPKTAALPVVVIGQCSKMEVIRGLHRVGVRATSTQLSAVMKAAGSNTFNDIILNEEMLYELQGDSDGDFVYVVPFNHRSSVDYRPGITSMVQKLKVDPEAIPENLRARSSANSSTMVDRLYKAMLGGIGIADYRTFQFLAYFNAVGISRNRSVVLEFARIYSLEYQAIIYGAKHTISYLSVAKDMLTAFRSSTGLKEHPDAVFNRVIRKHSGDDAPETIEEHLDILRNHRRSTKSPVTDLYVEVYESLLNANIPCLRDEHWAISWRRFAGPITWSRRAKLRVIRKAARAVAAGLTVDKNHRHWDACVYWAAHWISNGTISDIAWLIAGDEDMAEVGTTPKVVSFGLALAAELNIDLSGVRAAMAEHPYVAAPLSGGSDDEIPSDEPKSVAAIAADLDLEVEEDGGMFESSESADNAPF